MYEDDETFLEWYQVTEADDKKIMLALQVEGIDMRFEVDTGAAVTVVSDSTYRRHLAHCQLSACDRKYKGFGQAPASMRGETTVQVCYQGKNYSLPLVVSSYGDTPLLLGRPWIRQLPLPWKTLNASEPVTVPSDTELVG